MPLSSTTPCRASHRIAAPRQPGRPAFTAHNTRHSLPVVRNARTCTYYFAQARAPTYTHALALPLHRVAHHRPVRPLAIGRSSVPCQSVSSAVLPSPSAGIFPLLTTGGLTPVMPETLSPTSNLAGLGLGLEGGGCLAASLPRCLAPSLAHKILHPISLVFRDAERARTVERTSTFFRTQRATTTLRAAAAMCMRSAA